ncbi:5867_t:CDS:1, partial [Acaulospora colombiana]
QQGLGKLEKQLNVQDGGERAAIEHLAARSRLPELLREGQSDILLQIVPNFIGFVDDIGVVFWLLGKTSNDGTSFIPASLFTEPARRFLLKEHGHDEEDSGNVLQGEGDTPDLGRWVGISNVEEQAVVDPEGNSDTDDDE